MTITLYNTTDDYRKLQKTVGTPLATLTGDLHERVSDIQLVVRVPGSAALSVGAANYAYIDTLGKYYFREEFEEEEKKANAYLLDPDYQAKAYKKHVQRNFPVTLNDFSYILMTVG